MTSVTLSAKELECLQAVMAEMDDIPSVDFAKVGEQIGIKHARNARRSFKAVWDKLKGSSSAATGAGAAKAEAGTPDGSDEENGEETKESTAKAPAKAKAVAKAASKSTRKVPAKKTVGKATAPKKAGAAKVKAKGKGKKVQKDGVEGETKEGGEQEVDATEEAENEDGKSPSSINKSLATALQVNEESVAGNPANDYTEDEIYEAGERDISVEDWRIWKADNDYDPNYAPTPRGHVSDEES